LRFVARAATSPCGVTAFSSEVDIGSRQENASKRKTRAALLISKKRGSDNGGLVPQIREAMRAEVERLVEEIKQSVGLLRRHL
jgi:hypothetical protein